DVITGVQGSTTVLYEVELGEVETQEGGTTRRAYIRPVDEPQGAFEFLGDPGDRAVLVSRPQSSLSEVEQWAIDSDKQLEPMSRDLHFTYFGVITNAEGEYTFGHIRSFHRETHDALPVVRMRVTGNTEWDAQ